MIETHLEFPPFFFLCFGCGTLGPVMSCSLFFNTLTLCGFYEFMSLLSLAHLLFFSPARIWKPVVMLVFPFHFPACGMWLAFHVKLSQRVRGTERTELITFRQGCVIFLTTWCVPDRLHSRCLLSTVNDPQLLIAQC